MALILTIENEESLPNGAPVSVRLSDGRGLDIGRSANLDWTLPDPTRFISGRHCEIRYREDGYWLNDLSTNGTFLNDSPRRMQAPHKLRDGDRLTIGSYVIAVGFDEGDEALSAAPDPAAATDAEPPVQGAPVGAPDHAAAVELAVANAALPEMQLGRVDPDLLWEAPSGSAEAGGLPAGDFNDWVENPAPAEVPPVSPPLEPVRSVEPLHTPAEPGLPPPVAEEERSASPFEAEAGAQSRSPSDRCASERTSSERNSWARPAPAQGERELAAEASAEPAPSPEVSNPEVSNPEVPNRRPSNPSASNPGAEEFLRRFAVGAGVPEHIFARQNGLKVAEDLGALMRMGVENLIQLLSARFKAKRFARTSSQTMIQALDNNPLKFAPTPEDALKIMFGPRTSGYLDARRAFEGAFTDLKTHQVNTFAAMQQAVRMLVEDLDPKSLEQAIEPDGRFSGLFGSRKRRLWDLYLARWQAKTLRHEDGLVDAFMLYFAECYDKAKESK